MTDAQTDATPRKFRRKRASAGGFSLKLDAPQRPGFVRRFVLNDPSRIARMQNEYGYDFVTDKPDDGAKRTAGLGTRIARHAGKDENGKPQQLVLMECTQEDYDLGMADKEEQRKPLEDALKAGRDTQGQLENSYAPGRSALTHSS